MEGKCILLDLDGTLVPLARQVFEPALFRNIDQMFEERFPNQPEALKVFKRASMRCVRTEDHSETNEKRMIRILHEEGPEYADSILEELERHYHGDYNRIRDLITNESIAKDIFKLVKKYNASAVLATNPVSSAACIQARMDWVGIRPEQFVFVTSYEKCHYLKPDWRYYQEVLEAVGVNAKQCLMIGNDTEDDMKGAEDAGIHAFLMTDYLMDRNNTAGCYDRGTSKEVLDYLEQFLAEGE